MATQVTQRAKRGQPRQQATQQATQVQRRASAHTARAGSAGGVNEWEAWLAQFRPEARALMDLMIEVNCRLARESIARHVQTAVQTASVA